MRLLVATPLYPPEPGGPATYARALEQGLPSKGIEVITVRFGEVRHLPKGVRHAVYFWRVLVQLRSADLVLALDPVSVGLPARIAALVLRKPFIVKVVGDYAWEQGRQRHSVWLTLDEFVRTKKIPFLSQGLRAVQTFVAMTAKGVIVPSNYLKTIVTKWGVPTERITVIYNAVLAVEPSELQPALGQGSGPTILTVGRLVPWKGVQGIITALSTVRKTVPEARLVIVGEGPEEENLKEYAANRLPPDVVIFTGRLAPSETLAAISTCDVFLLNSAYEGLSHVLIEAMSLGKPIIATKAGGNPELIRDGETGLLVSVGDTKGLIEAIVTLLTHPEEAKVLGEQAKVKSKDFSGERMMEETSAYLKSSI